MWGGQEDGIGESMLRQGLLGPVLSRVPPHTPLQNGVHTQQVSPPGLKEAGSPELWGLGFVLLQ